jgi:hypothetical protein
LDLSHVGIDESGQSELVQMVKDSTSLVKFDLLEDWMEDFAELYTINDTLKRNKQAANQDICLCVCYVVSGLCRESSVFDRSLVKIVFRLLV